MADWTERLTRARWRGFEFLTDALDSTHGQRLVVTELPGADEPVVEDLGAKAPTYRLSAYFIGAQYDLQRNQFLDLLATPGAAWLYRPLMVDVWVRAQTWSVRESNDKGGYCTVQVDFVPGGQQLSEPTTDLADIAFESVASMMEAADFDPLPMSTDELAVFIDRVQGALNVVRNVLAKARGPLTWLLKVQAQINAVKGIIAEALALPGEYAQVLRTLANSFASAPDEDSSTGEKTSDAQRTRTVAALARCATAVTSESLVGLPTATLRRNAQADMIMRATQLAAAAMTVALADYQDATARANAISAVLTVLDVLMPLQLDQAVAATDSASADQAAAAADGVRVDLALVATDSVRVDLALAALTSARADQAFTATANARAALLQVLAAQVATAEVVRDVVRPLPAVVLALDMAADEATLLARNAVRHPLFVQGRVYG
jgi:prophage DNA circulation protein